jgi:transcriptional regulator GlxA family with amidase domain
MIPTKIASAFLYIGYFLSLFSCRYNEDIEKSLNKIDYSDTTFYNVGFLIMDGTYNTELIAPYDIFQHTKYREGIKKMRVFTVSESTKIVTTFEGLKVIPDFVINDPQLPKIDILVVPSAEHNIDTDLNNIQIMKFLQKVDKEAKFVTSHCDGAFLLANAGLLVGRQSTTFPSDILKYKQMFPTLNVRDSVLFVHDGKYITSVGGAKSFEAALYLCEYLYGSSIARDLSKGLVINWNLDSLKYIYVEE